jgi:hypothetical protein
MHPRVPGRSDAETDLHQNGQVALRPASIAVIAVNVASVKPPIV